MGRTIVSVDGCFEWDEEKAIANQKKHGIAFEKVLPVLLDPRKLEFHDAMHSDYEEWYITIGNASQRTVLLVIVCSTERDGRTRLISARLASRIEEGIYYGK
ncbi:MAG: hypothetical protein CVV52_07070 [Spirochaetae bacterium HGW-Spirochaetae-8]|nr:MAG: hypothetical protein CVV52_07070 [Spirochaetae bacterium HGW-Spirochaetae-8]